MTSIETITLGVADPAAAHRFYTTAFGLDDQVRLRASQEPTSGFRGFTLSLTVPRPADVDALVGAALAAGATSLKPVARSFWGYGGAVQAPDGTAWTIASSAKKDTGPATGRVESLVLLLGVEDVRASRRFYVEQGMTAGKSFGGKYAELETPGSPVSLALYGRRQLAKHAGVPADGTGSHRLVVGSTGDGFTDPDGFTWEPAADREPAGSADPHHRAHG